MSGEMIIYALVGLAILFLIIKLLKWPIKILINGIVGIVLLYVANYIGEYFNFYIIKIKSNSLFICTKKETAKHICLNCFFISEDL